MDGGGDTPAPAGREFPLPISPPHLDSDAPPPGAPGEAESGGVGQDDVPVLQVVQRQVGLFLGGAGRGVYDRQVIGNGRSGEVLDVAGFPAPRLGGHPAGGGIGHDDVPVLPVAQRQFALFLGGAGIGIYDRQVLGNAGPGVEVLDAAAFAAPRPGGDPEGDEQNAIGVNNDGAGERVAQDPAGGDVGLHVLPEQHAVGVNRDGADHIGERVAEDPQGIQVGADDTTPDAPPPAGRGGDGIGAGNPGLGAGRAALPPRGRGRGGDHPGAALPPRGRGRGGEHRRSGNVQVVDLHGPGANRPDAKGETVPRLGRKFQSADDSTNAMNYQLQKLYRQLLERKADAREADERAGRKAALAIAKEYQKGLSKADSLRRQIARAQGIPVDKPKDLSKDPLA